MSLYARAALIAMLLFATVPYAHADDQWLTPPVDAAWRPIASCEEHAYRLFLREGEVLRGTIEQDTTRTSVRLLRISDGAERTFDVNDSEGGFERFLAIADRSGEYSLIVANDESVIPAMRYRLRIDPLRQATDRDRVEEIAETLLALGTAEALAQAAELCAGTDAAVCESDALGNLAVHYWLEGSDLRPGVPMLERAAALRRAAGDAWGEGTILGNLALFHQALGNLPEAIAVAERALPLRPSRIGRGDPLLLHNAAPAYWRLGEWQKAIDSEQSVLETWTAANDLNGQAFAHATLGHFALQLGDLDGALRHQTTALELWTKVNNAQGQAKSHFNLGMIDEARGRRSEALNRYWRSAEMAAKASAPQEHAKALVRSGGLLATLGRYGEARKAYEEAIALMRAMNVDDAAAVKGLGDIAAYQGRYDHAVDLYRKTLDATAISLDQPLRAETWLALARIERDRGRLQRAREALAEATSAVELLRLRIANPDIRSSYLATKASMFELETDVLMELAARTGRDAYVREAFESSERARARGLLDWLTIAEVPDPANATVALREKDLRDRINGKADVLARVKPADRGKTSTKKLHDELDRLLADYRDVRSEIARAHGYAGSVSTAAEIQQSLDGETLLLEYALGPARSFLWVVSRDRIRAFELPSRRAIEARATQLALSYPKSYLAAEAGKTTLHATRLSETILGPAAALLAGKRLAIVADGALQYVSFAALPDPNAMAQPLMVNHEIVMLPSGSALSPLRRERKVTSRGLLAVVADPVVTTRDPRLRGRAARASHPADLLRSSTSFGSAEFDRLPHTRVEADRIASLIPEGQKLRMLGFQASREEALAGSLEGYRHLHFATHGLVNAEHPELSGLVLSLYREDGSPQDGFLRLHDIYNLQLSADLVVISACKTALGRDVKREGLIGLTRGFMYAGAPRVVASLWDVRDSATAELMERFYERLLRDRMRPAAALRSAQVSMWREPRWKAPFYWAAFTLQGDWK